MGQVWQISFFDLTFAEIIVVCHWRLAGKMAVFNLHTFFLGGTQTNIVPSRTNRSHTPIKVGVAVTNDFVCTTLGLPMHYADLQNKSLRRSPKQVHMFQLSTSFRLVFQPRSRYTGINLGIRICPLDKIITKVCWVNGWIPMMSTRWLWFLTSRICR